MPLGQRHDFNDIFRKFCEYRKPKYIIGTNSQTRWFQVGTQCLKGTIIAKLNYVLSRFHHCSSFKQISGLEGTEKYKFVDKYI